MKIKLIIGKNLRGDGVKEIREEEKAAREKLSKPFWWKKAKMEKTTPPHLGHFA